MKRIYITRHGETRFNKLRRVQGASDSPLTDLGIQQAKLAANYYTDKELDAAFSSTQERAVDTMELILNNSGHSDVPTEHLKGLKEWDFGVFEGESEVLNPVGSDPDTYYGNFFAENNYGGETGLEVRKRMVEALEDIVKRPGLNNILVVSHGGSIASLLGEYGFDDDWRKISGNLGLIVLGFDETKDKFSLLNAKNFDQQINTK